MLANTPPLTETGLPWFRIGYNDITRNDVCFGFDTNNPSRLAISKDEGRSFQGLPRIATSEDYGYLSGTSRDYHQYARPDGTFEVIVVEHGPVDTYVVFNDRRSKPIGDEYVSTDSIDWPSAEARAIEQSFYVQIEGVKHYYVLTSTLRNWGTRHRNVKLFYGTEGELHQIPVWETKKANDFGGYRVITHDGELRVLRPQYDRLIPGSDEMTSFVSGQPSQASTWHVQDEPTRSLVNVWDSRHQLFKHDTATTWETVALRTE